MNDTITNVLDIQTDRLYDQAALAEMFGKPVSWFERARWAGVGPRFIKIGRSVRYRGQDIIDWLEAQVRQSTSDNGGGGHAQK